MSTEQQPHFQLGAARCQQVPDRPFTSQHLSLHGGRGGRGDTGMDGIAAPRAAQPSLRNDSAWGWLQGRQHLPPSVTTGLGGSRSSPSIMAALSQMRTAGPGGGGGWGGGIGGGSVWSRTGITRGKIRRTGKRCKEGRGGKKREKE